MTRYIRLLGVMLLVACVVEKEEKLGMDVPSQGNANTGQGDGEEDDGCMGAEPVISEVLCSNSGIQTHPDYGTLPTLTITANFTDEDQDMNYYTFELLYDEELDGQVAAEAASLETNGTAGSDECSVGQGEAGVTIYLQGGDPAFDTEYEWYVILTDINGYSSNTAMAVCRTPNSDGTGDP